MSIILVYGQLLCVDYRICEYTNRQLIKLNWETVDNTELSETNDLTYV